MCGIIGYTGKRNALPILLDGLKRLEYRGYDSAGISILNNNSLIRLRAVGQLSALEKRLNDELNKSMADGATGIAHTRWATHGSPTENNAHPHADCADKLHLVHNGIIENYQTLKSSLESAGHIFSSETDTEALAHLIEQEINNGQSLDEAVMTAVQQIKGTLGLAVVAANEPDKIVAARRSSPLLLGIGQGEYFIASDPSAIIPHTSQVIYLKDDEFAIITPAGYEIKSLSGQSVAPRTETIDWSISEITRGGYDTFMEKEIFEGPSAIANALRGRLLPDDGNVKLGGLDAAENKLRYIDKLVIVSCGTSYYAGLAGAMMIEEYAKLPVAVLHASEFRYRDIPLDKNTAVLAISQSGETADTLAAIHEAKKRGLLTLGIVNVVGSSIARETEAGVYNHAGPEISVASTKAFISQLTVLGLLTVYLGRTRTMPLAIGQRIVRELARLPDLTESILKQAHKICAIAERYNSFKNFLYIGRKYNYPTALEGALKLKEISYIHAEGYPGGELKHGPLALVTTDLPTVAIVLRDSIYEKMLSNIQEIRARQGPIIAIATENDARLSELADDIFYMPKTIEMLSPILAVIPLQLFAYEVAKLHGRDIDKPRNLAKSVTVE
ncbi:glutamine--fructose-6-phosphate aminotransferase [Candidatus Uhrbacteria bacterium RIFCSPLOWO2_12_FULL_46_10]|uniref:Glutamine--fructose-6-phosphate aminotransferase [isomerizing] n=1 Tax=Candidatus Uhrbacteria bacterium RIFCSPLOWO2_01_FULL_47_25 TaxID=1802402 RepID=A0A1F7URW5_9BACT|nr:MAG: Isomerizing Glutamine-fructose-6-phosphate aminotransferase [Parcubacteria group bacterium GW2011_GWA2_46_9]OGL60613.1 MAG: glutamine--fructose-6-phosphate aminotransferase [Candidatus Uhrbacteria bacterium RIFCSPHIGHO2_01_FULL_46_23]OGL68148.1 MAG: glutamine--fructose-6-phosphate aminotransferase [Candidatus Uhrbacteria bacterium RIFCSPHIGHO2_02_FULL_47_29]OGL74808.1 MAG: glutamine--fructose-6-phosphate aminotransferase [Candidatus Uhrbacteria bacterium RIFCSPHIGHO2_12_FULL_46_13]OGL80